MAFATSFVYLPHYGFTGNQIRGKNISVSLRSRCLFVEKGELFLRGSLLYRIRRTKWYIHQAATALLHHIELACVETRLMFRFVFFRREIVFIGQKKNGGERTDIIDPREIYATIIFVCLLLLCLICISC